MRLLVIPGLTALVTAAPVWADVKPTKGPGTVTVKAKGASMSGSGNDMLASPVASARSEFALRCG